MTKQTEITVLAALALAAQQYYDPAPCYEAIRELHPNTDWTNWITDVEAARQARAEVAAA